MAEAQRAEQALREREAELAEELADARLLQELSAQLIPEGNAEVLHRKIIATARAIMRADFASMQILYPERGRNGELQLLAFEGFTPAAAKLWEWVRIDSASSCGLALRERRRVVVPDCEACDFMVGTEDLAGYRESGIRAVQTTPLFTRNGHLVGMMSTHWREPYVPLDRDLRLLDIVAREAADLIERMQAQDALRASDNGQRFLVELNNATQALTDPDWIMKGTAQMLGQYLGADRCLYAEVEGDEEHFNVLGDYTSGVRSMVGRWQLSAFGTIVRDLCRAGMNWVLHDVDSDPRIPDVRETYRAAEIGSGIVVPLRKGGQLVSGMAVQTRTARHWTREEVELIELVVNRCWEAIERARALRSLAESEAKLRVALGESERAQEALRQSDRRKDEFLATLSHELRNPLAPLSLAAQMLGGRVRDDEKAGELAETVQRQVDHMVRLIDELMDISRISRGKVELRREGVDLSSVVDNGIELARPHIEEARHTLTVSLPEQPIRLHADPVRLGQILANLLNNAAKYTPPGGRIDLQVVREGGGITLRVSDSGSGITAEAMPHIFQLFGRGERAARDDGGLGIGLYLAKGLAELHGGNLTASSEGTGRGSEFTLRLPDDRHDVPAAVVPEAPSPGPTAPAGVRALVVDDNRGAARMMGIALKTMGANVRVVFDGQSALDTAAEFQPEIVFMDIGMPGMDGHEAARRIRARNEHRATVMVAVSGWGQHEVRNASLEAGFDHHFVKPVDLPQLRHLLASCRRQMSAVSGG